MRYGLACILTLAVLAACTQPDTGNHPPVASFNDLQASGAGSSQVDGYYRENGSNQSRPKYDRVGGGWDLYYLTATDAPYIGMSFWSIQNAVDTTMTDAYYYNGDLVAVTAPEGTWSLVLGLDPAPSVQRFAITGTLGVGDVLTGQYNYSDPDGDAESGTTFQWYNFTSATATSGGTACTGTGANTLTYTVAAGDSTKFLRLQVTPVDNLGLAGTPALSGAVKIP